MGRSAAADTLGMASPWIRFALRAAGIGRKSASALGFAAWLALGLRAQPPGQFPTQSFGFQDGLTNLSINALQEDAQGFLWAGTEAGLFRYGGHRFEAVPLPPSFRYATHLLPQAGGLWVGTLNGLGFLDTATFAFLPAPGASQARVSHLGLDGTGQVWVLMAGAPPQVAGPSGAFTPAPGWPGQGPAQALFAHPASPSVAVAEGRFLWHWHSARKAWERWDLPFRHPDEASLALAQDGDGFLWLRSNLSLYRCPPGSRAWESLPTRYGGDPPDGLQMSRDREGFVWFNTVDGMYRGRGLLITPVRGGPKGFVPVAGMVDREGSYWFGSVGVVHVLGRGLWTRHTVEDGLPSNVVWHAVRDRRGCLWLATDSGLVVGEEGRWKVVRKGQFSRLRLAPDGHLLAVGSPGGMVYRIEPRTHRIETLRVGTLPLTPVSRGLAVEPDGRVWVSDFRDGVASGRQVGGRWIWERAHFTGEPPRGLWHVGQDQAGSIFLSTRSALYLLESGTWQRLEDTLPASPFAATWAPDGSLWVTYHEKPVLTRHRRIAGRWVREAILEPFGGREDRVIYSQAFDAKGRLWLGTTMGLGRLDASGQHLEAWLSPGEGIPGSDPTNQGLLLEADGTLWYGTTEGIGEFRTQDEQPVLPLPAPRIVHWRTNQKALPVTGGLPLLEPGSSLEATFALNAFSLPGGLGLESRLVGLQADWIPMESYQTRFPSLPPGAYRLEVRGNRHGSEPGPSLVLEFRVKPYWWQTWWASLLWLGTLGSVVWMAITLRHRVLWARNQALQAEVLARTRELQAANLALDKASKAKSLFLASMSHELRTPLNAILLYGELMAEDAEARGDQAVKADVQKIQTAGHHLFTLINGILDLSKIEAGMVEVDLGPCPIGPLFWEVAQTLRPLAEQGGNAFEVEVPGDLPAPQADPTRLLQVLLNLGGNACKFTQNGRITLRARREGAGILLEVEDTGRGMTEEEQGRIFQAFEQANSQIQKQYGGTGLGLAISQRLVELMGGTLSVRSAPGEGSSFTVVLPES